MSSVVFDSLVKYPGDKEVSPVYGGGGGEGCRPGQSLQRMFEIRSLK